MDDYRWLLSSAAEPWIAEASQSDTLSGAAMVRLVQRLRKSLSPGQAHLVVELVELRRRARDKFAAAERMFFTRVGLEQATDERIAAYKAGRFAEGQRVADLCCGIGGDLLALGKRGLAVGVDASEIVALIAGRNCEANGSEMVSVQCEKAEAVALADFSAWHVDPDRRPDGKRTTRIELHQPPLETLERMLKENPNAAIKLAPAAEIPLNWEERAECEWLGSRGECRQLVVWHGNLAQNPGQRAATLIDARGGIRRVVGQAGTESEGSQLIGRYLYEPHAAVLAAGLSGALSETYALKPIAPRVAYLTGDQAIDDPAIDGFEVLEMLPFDLKRLIALLTERNVGRVEVKKRGVDVDPLSVQKTLQKKLPASADEIAVILLMPREKQVIAVLGRRIS